MAAGEANSPEVKAGIDFILHNQQAMAFGTTNVSPRRVFQGFLISNTTVMTSFSRSGHCTIP